MLKDAEIIIVYIIKYYCIVSGQELVKKMRIVYLGLIFFCYMYTEVNFECKNEQEIALEKKNLSDQSLDNNKNIFNNTFSLNEGSFLKELQQSNDQEKTPIHVTIFVHGIMSIKPYLDLPNLIRFIKDKIINTLYAKGVELTRRTQYFWWGQAMQGFGLQPIDLTFIQKTKAASAIALLYDKVFVETFGDTYERYYYTFGWSGLLSHKQRYYDAHEFFVHLEQLVRILEEQNKKPMITIIGYSHGGNVALDLAAVQENFYPQSTLSVDTLILLGTPLLTETDHLVSSPFFKKVYNVVSPLDRIQTLDFFSYSRFFSSKFFKNRRHFKIPEKLTQVVLKLMKPIQTKKGPQVKQKRKVLRKDFSNPAIISGRSRLLTHVSAGHIELWFFGWTPQHYTKNFIFNPLPMVVFLPYILGSIEKEFFFDRSVPVIADIRPHDDVMILKQYKKHKSLHNVVSFLKKPLIKSMEEVARRVKPDNYTEYDFKRYLYEAYHNAKIIYDESLVFIRKSQRIQKKRARMRMKMSAHGLIT